MKKFLDKFIRDESGASAVEYGILVGVIAVVVIGAISTLGGTVKNEFVEVNTELTKS